MVILNAATMTKRTKSAPTMSRRRSIRSAIAPVTIDNTSHGKRVAMVIPAMSTGSRVNVAARSGNAVTNMPSPLLEITTANQSCRNGRPSDR